jgi:hypothetical protein
MFPPDNIWNTRVDDLPVHPQSDAYVNTIGQNRTVHPDFGSGLYEGRPIGIPFTVVPGDQPRVPISYRWPHESDPGPFPIPTDAPIEGGPDHDGDRHVLVLDRDDCVLYELYHSFPQPDGSWRADSGARFDLASHALRPETWTSADAAGLPILPGLVRFDEVMAGEIRHAIRFTAPQTRRAYVWPARHYASDLVGAEYPPLGQYFRLKASFDESGFSPPVVVLLRALKTYGMILADNGSPWYLSGAPDEGWDNDMFVGELRRVRGSDFEAVDVSGLTVHPDSGQARRADAPSPVPSATSTPTVTPSAETSTETPPAPTAPTSPTPTSPETPTPPATPTDAPVPASATSTSPPTPTGTLPAPTAGPSATTHTPPAPTANSTPATPTAPPPTTSPAVTDPPPVRLFLPVGWRR